MDNLFSCIGLVLVYLLLFYLWGKSFLTIIRVKTYIADCIVFGFLAMLIVFQFLYLPFFLTRASFRMLSIIWLILLFIITVVAAFHVSKAGIRRSQGHNSPGKWVCLIVSCGITAFLAVYISILLRGYGNDLSGYITVMNKMYYNDVIYATGGILDLHHGLNSLFGFFTMPAVITGIKPIYLGLFLMRMMAVSLTSIVAYRAGRAVFKDENAGFSWPGIVLSFIVPISLMTWESIYKTDFYFLRSNEAKAYVQLVLLPLAFSVFVRMFLKDADFSKLWKLQLMAGLAAIPMGTSSMTAYIFLVIIGTAALLAFEELRNAGKHLLWAFCCMLPNLLYIGLFVCEKFKIISL